MSDTATPTVAEVTEAQAVAEAPVAEAPAAEAAPVAEKPKGIGAKKKAATAAKATAAKAPAAKAKTASKSKAATKKPTEKKAATKKAPAAKKESARSSDPLWKAYEEAVARVGGKDKKLTFNGFRILKAIGKGTFTHAEVAAATGIDVNSLPRIMWGGGHGGCNGDSLVNRGFVSRKEDKERGPVYTLKALGLKALGK